MHDIIEEWIRIIVELGKDAFSHHTSSTLFLKDLYLMFWKNMIVYVCVVVVALKSQGNVALTKLKLIWRELTIICWIKYSRLSLSRNRRDPLKQFEISVLRHIRFVVLRKKQFEQQKCYK